MFASLLVCLQTKRATTFLTDLFNLVDDRVVLVVTHSGFTRSVLLAVGREPYRYDVKHLCKCICICLQVHS